MAQTRKQRLGHWGEIVASHFLEKQGYQLLGQNIRTSYGEIDLIVSHSGCLVFVEVKTRTNMRFGYPEEAVTARKLEHMIAAAQAYVAQHPELDVQHWQIDVIAIQGQPGDRVEDVQIEHFENIGS